MSKLADFIRLKQEKDRAFEEELLQEAAVAAQVPAQWSENLKALHEAIELANREFEAANQPNRFQYLIEAEHLPQHRHAQGELRHIGAPEAPLSVTRIIVELSGDIICQSTVGSKMLEPGSTRLEPDFPWHEFLAELYKRDERLEER